MSAERLTSNGRRWPRRAPRPDRWSTFRYVVIREALATAAENPLTPISNTQYRSALARMHDYEVRRWFDRLIASWPARNNRP